MANPLIFPSYKSFKQRHCTYILTSVELIFLECQLKSSQLFWHLPVKCNLKVIDLKCHLVDCESLLFTDKPLVHVTIVTENGQQEMGRVLVSVKVTEGSMKWLLSKKLFFILFRRYNLLANKCSFH